MPFDNEKNRASDAPNPQGHEEDPLMQLKGLGAEDWRSLGGGDAVIKWLRSDEVISPPWDPTGQHDGSEPNEEPSSATDRAPGHREEKHE